MIPSSRPVVHRPSTWLCTCEANARTQGVVDAPSGASSRLTSGRRADTIIVMTSHRAALRSAGIIIIR